jgi:hypothetical protein
MKLQYKIEIKNEANDIIFTEIYKSLHDMSKDENVNIPYHQLRALFKNDTSKKYTNTSMQRLAKYVKIVEVMNSKK